MNKQASPPRGKVFFLDHKHLERALWTLKFAAFNINQIKYREQR